MIRPIVYYGDPVLRQRCEEILTIDAEVLALAEDLCDTVRSAKGAGLAAPQIGIPRRLFVVCYGQDDPHGRPTLLDQPEVWINPQITPLSQEGGVEEEGCLSIPGLLRDVERPDRVQIVGKDIEGGERQEEAWGWRARVMMHENDHLNGKLFIDRLSKKERRGVQRHLNNLAR
ncbi:MAG: peptide deformylase [Chlamydiota bacterium]|nr:peptide deformylase [Chlamydiota bacterium]